WGAGSTGRRNTGVKSLCWGFKLQRSRVVVHLADPLRSDDTFVSAITERVTVTIECRGTAQVSVEHLGSLREKPLLDEVDHPLHRFTLIDRVGDHPFQPCG